MAAVIIFVHALTRQEMLDGQLHNLFGEKQSGAGTDYGYVEVTNIGNQTLSSGLFWINVDPTGATLSAALADGGTVRAASYTYSPFPSVPGSFSTPVDAGTGLAIPSLATNEKVMVCIARDTTGATPSYPENNSLEVQGTSPL